MKRFQVDVEKKEKKRKERHPYGQVTKLSDAADPQWPYCKSYAAYRDRDRIWDMITTNISEYDDHYQHIDNFTSAGNKKFTF